MMMLVFCFNLDCALVTGINGCIRKPLGNGIRDCTCVAIVVVETVAIAGIPTGSQDGHGFQQRIYTMVMYFSVGRRKATTSPVPVVVGRGVRICSRHRGCGVRTESSQGTWKGWQ